MKKLGENRIVGNSALCRRLYSDIKAGTLSHAYIIEGAKGSGRHTLARNIIAALACTSKSETLPCGECRDCRHILSDQCPDFMLIGRGDRATLGIDSIRELKSTILTVANDLEFKAYILEDADTMTPAAQNAFLLTLEQPPARVYFFLLCENARALLETIRSRAAVLRTEPLSDDEINKHLISVSNEAKRLKSENCDEYRAVIFTSNGSIGRALELLSPKVRKPIMETRWLTERFISSLKSGTVSEHPLMLLSSFSQKRDELELQLEYIRNAVRDLILLKKNENVELCFFMDREEGAELSSLFSERRLIAVFEKISAAMSSLSANANVRLTVTNLLSGL